MFNVTRGGSAASKETKIAYIDGDLLAFRIAASLETKYLLFDVDGTKKTFKNITAFRKWCEVSGLDATAYTHEVVVDWPDDWEKQAQDVLDWKQRGWQFKLKGYTYVLVLGEGESFRVERSKMCLYKGNRKTEDKPKNLGLIRKWLSTKFTTVIATDGEESDDRLVILAQDGGVVISADKDFWTCRCRVMQLDDPKRIDNADCFGELYLTQQGVKGLGRKFFYFQLLFGDISDNYRPFILSTTVKKYGEKKVYADLSPLKTDKECWQFIIDKYKEAYPKGFLFQSWDGKEYLYDHTSALQEIIDMAYMRHKPNDRLLLKDVVERHGLDWRTEENWS